MENNVFEKEKLAKQVSLKIVCNKCDKVFRTTEDNKESLVFGYTLICFDANKIYFDCPYCFYEYIIDTI